MRNIILAFALGGIIAVAPLIVFFCFNEVFEHVISFLPLRVRSYALFFPMPAFFIGGVVGGLSTRSGIRGAVAFGLGLLLPGFYIPTAFVGTQGASGFYDVIRLTMILPSGCYCLAGAFGACFLRCGMKGVVRVAAGFALGGFLGPALAWFADESLAIHLGHSARLVGACLGLVFPWCLGGLAIASVLAPAHARKDISTSREGDTGDGTSVP